MLLELKKVARKVKSCSKVAEHNRAMPSSRYVCDFSSLTDEGIGGQSPDILNRATVIWGHARYVYVCNLCLIYLCAVRRDFIKVTQHNYFVLISPIYCVHWHHDNESVNVLDRRYKNEVASPFFRNSEIKVFCRRKYDFSLNLFLNTIHQH